MKIEDRLEALEEGLTRLKKDIPKLTMRDEETKLTIHTITTSHLPAVGTIVVMHPVTYMVMQHEMEIPSFYMDDIEVTIWLKEVSREEESKPYEW